MVFERSLMALSFFTTLAFLGVTRFGPNEWPAYTRLVCETNSVVQDNLRLTQKVETTRRQIRALRERPEIQEQVIRTALGYVRPGDVVYRIEGASGTEPVGSLGG